MFSWLAGQWVNPMGFISALFKKEPATPPIRSCNCKSAIGPARNVKHAVEVGSLYLAFCDACHREAVRRNDAVNRAIKANIRAGRNTRDEVNPFTTSGLQCLQCARRLNRTGTVADLAETGVGLTITLSRPRNASENVTNLYGKERKAPVADIFTLCVACAKEYLPGIAPNWAQEAETAKAIRSVHIPM